jgi:hypothetical protein
MIPSTGWFVVDAISTSPTISTFRVNTDGSASTITISSLNTQYASYFNIYAVNDPGYSIPMSTIAVIPIPTSEDPYTYFDISVINGSNDFYYRIYNSQTGWGSPVDTGLNYTNYSYTPFQSLGKYIGAGSNFMCARFYNSNTMMYAVPFVTTTGELLETMTWNGATDNFSCLPNSYTSDVFFSYSSNSTSGLYDIQLYQPTTRLYQHSSIHTSTYSNNDGDRIEVYVVALEHSVAFFTKSAISGKILSYTWSPDQPTPNLVFQANFQTDPLPVNQGKGFITTASFITSNYYDGIIYEGESGFVQLLTANTYTSNSDNLNFGKDNTNYRTTLYNSNTSLYDLYIFNNFSNYSGPVILSNLSTFGVVMANYSEYLATRQTSVLQCYDIDSSHHGIVYSVFEDGSVFSNVYISNIVISPNFLNAYQININSNATTVLQIDSSNTLSIDICSQGIGTTTLAISSASAYSSSLAQYAQIDFYTNFFSFYLPLTDGVSYQFITVQSDTATITASNTNLGIYRETYCGSTGMVLYSNGSTDVLHNGVVTYTIPSMTDPSLSTSDPDLALGTMYVHNYDRPNFNLYTAHPNGTLTSTVTGFITSPMVTPSYTATPAGFFAWTDMPFTVMAQTLDDSQFFHSTVGPHDNFTYVNAFTSQSNSILFEILDTMYYGEITTIYVVFDYTTRTFNEYNELNSTVQTAITTSPYLFYQYTS